MAWVVDSCVLLDVALKDPVHGLTSALFLEGKRSAGLVVCPMSVIEVAPFFGGRVQSVREFLKVMGAQAEEWMGADTEAAAEGWARYVQRKRMGDAARRPLADILIGGFAERYEGLVTRNPDHFRPYFPKLNLAAPRQGGEGQ